MPKIRDRSEQGQALYELKASRAMALLPEEKETCQNVVVFGPGYLRQVKGWSVSASKAFLERNEVVREIEMLKRSYEDRTGIQERTQFFSQLRINSMVPMATNVLHRALAGRRTRPDGTVMDPPTKQQLEAAMAVLDRANVQGQKFNGNDQTPSIDARSVNLSIGGSPDNNGLDKDSRAKVAALLKHVTNRIATSKSPTKTTDVSRIREEDDDEEEEDSAAE